MPIFRDNFYLSLLIVLSGWIAGMGILFAVRRNPDFARRVFGKALYDKIEREE